MRISGRFAFPGRRAFMLVEVAITAMLLMIAMTVTLQLIGWVAAERRAVDRRQCALGEAANLMERLSARPWDELTSQAMKQVTLSEQARTTLPDAELSLTVDEVEEAGGGKRISLSLRWRNRAAEWVAPVRLTAWVHRRGEVGGEER